MSNHDQEYRFRLPPNSMFQCSNSFLKLLYITTKQKVKVLLKHFGGHIQKATYSKTGKFRQRTQMLCENICRLSVGWKVRSVLFNFRCQLGTAQSHLVGLLRSDWPVALSLRNCLN